MIINKSLQQLISLANQSQERFLSDSSLQTSILGEERPGPPQVMYRAPESSIKPVRVVFEVYIHYGTIMCHSLFHQCNVRRPLRFHKSINKSPVSKQN